MSYCVNYYILHCEDVSNFLLVCYLMKYRCIFFSFPITGNFYYFGFFLLFILYQSFLVSIYLNCYFTIWWSLKVGNSFNTTMFFCDFPSEVILVDIRWAFRRSSCSVYWRSFEYSKGTYHWARFMSSFIFSVPSFSKLHTPLSLWSGIWVYGLDKIENSKCIDANYFVYGLSRLCFNSKHFFDSKISIMKVVSHFPLKNIMTYQTDNKNWIIFVTK